MKAIKFKHANIIFAENQEEYATLHALKLQSQNGEVITCWKLSFKERLKLMFTGVIWLNVLTFNKELSPCFMSVNRVDMFVTEDDLNKQYWTDKAPQFIKAKLKEFAALAIFAFSLPALGFSLLIAFLIVLTLKFIIRW